MLPCLLLRNLYQLCNRCSGAPLPLEQCTTPLWMHLWPRLHHRNVLTSLQQLLDC
jgi:hypothetical protein